MRPFSNVFVSKLWINMYWVQKGSFSLRKVEATMFHYLCSLNRGDVRALIQQRNRYKLNTYIGGNLRAVETAKRNSQRIVAFMAAFIAPTPCRHLCEYFKHSRTVKSTIKSPERFELLWKYIGAPWSHITNRTRARVQFAEHSRAPHASYLNAPVFTRIIYR